MADEIQFEEPTFSVCECCGETTTHLVRFVNRDDGAFAVYFADFSPGHGYVSVLIGLGDWDENASADQRTAFALRIWSSDDAYQVGLVDAGDAAYPYDHLGKILDRDEALEHPWKQEVFDLSDHILTCDRPIIDFLENRTQA